MSVVLGVGGRASADPGALLALVQQQLAAHGLGGADVDVVATIDSRADHPGIALLALSLDAGIRAFAAGELAAQPVSHPSATVAARTGTPSVAEAAVLAAGASPLAPPTRADAWVVVVGRTGLPRHDLAHHGDVEIEEGMLDFAVNVHASEPPAFLADALHAAIADLARYPDPSRATAAVARAHGIEPESVLLTHGAAEAFGLVAQQPWVRPAVVHPQFTEPEAALRAHGHDPARLVLEAATGFRLTSPELQVRPASTRSSSRPGTQFDLVVVGNPTNPTSRLHTRAEIRALGADGATVLVDEAFLDAVEAVDAPEHSLVREAASGPGLLVARSLTKTYSIAGLRIGYLVGHPDVLSRLAVRRSPWPVSTLAAVAAEACVSAEGLAYAAEVRRQLPAQIAALARALTRRGFTVVDDPRGPFVLAQHPDATRLRDELRARRIAVRRADTFPGLDGTWLRFAARGPAETSALADALDALDLGC